MLSLDKRYVPRKKCVVDPSTKALVRVILLASFLHSCSKELDENPSSNGSPKSQNTLHIIEAVRGRKWWRKMSDFFLFSCVCVSVDEKIISYNMYENISNFNFIQLLCWEHFE